MKLKRTIYNRNNCFIEVISVYEGSYHHDKKRLKRGSLLFYRYKAKGTRGDKEKKWALESLKAGGLIDMICYQTGISKST